MGCLPLLTEVFSGHLSKISKLLYFHRSSKLLLLFAVVIFDLRSANCVFFFHVFFLNSFSFYLPHKNIVQQLFFTEIFLPKGTPNKFKNKGNSKGCVRVCVCRGEGG